MNAFLSVLKAIVAAIPLINKLIPSAKIVKPKKINMTESVWDKPCKPLEK